jgi:hypothetical protein
MLKVSLNKEGRMSVRVINGVNGSKLSPAEIMKDFSIKIT